LYIYQEVDVALEVDAAATCELNVEVRTIRETKGLTIKAARRFIL
jgi:hypothetical protein